jgi:putative ABC transport system permease protein
LIQLGLTYCNLVTSSYTYVYQKYLPWRVTMGDLLQDLRFGARVLAKSPGFTAVAALSLALGIGANTAIFSLVDAVLLRPLNFQDPDRLCIVWEDAREIGFPKNTPAPANYADWKSQNQTFETLAAMTWTSFSLTGDGTPEKVQANLVTSDFLPMLGVRPLYGRFFFPEEDKPGSNDVAILSYGLWKRRYGGDPALTGKDILLDDRKTTVVGIMPMGFQFLEEAPAGGAIDLWKPVAFTAEALNNRGSHYLTVAGRLKDGVTLAQAQSDIETITRRIAAEHPDHAKDLRANVFSMRDQIAGDVRPALLVLLAAVAMVLLIACVNVANLQLSRSASRAKEIAVRSALGASRWRLTRQILTESILLSGVGALLGLLLARLSFGFLKQLVPTSMALSAGLTLNFQVLAFTVLVSTIAGVLFGLAPARRAGRIDLNESLKAGGRGAGFAGRGIRRMLVVSEVSVALLLLVGAGLLIRTFVHLQKLDLGFRPDNVLAVRTTLPFRKYGKLSTRSAFYTEVLERVQKLPGVASAGYSTAVPLTWKGGTNGFVVEDHPQPMFDSDAMFRQVSGDYFRAIGTPLRRGRVFDSHDGADTLPVGIVNETMARQFWEGQDPIGTRFAIDDGPGNPRRWVTVVGIVADVSEMGIQAPRKAEMYFPYQQTDVQWNAPRDLVIHTTGDPMALAGAVRSEVWAVDASQPVSNIRPLEDILEGELVQQRLGTVLLAVFAGLALLLAGIGIYGVLSYGVAQRTQEIGVRMALGATRGNVLRLVIADAMVISAAGIGLGLGGALALTRLMTTLLFGVSTTDPLTFASVPAILVIVSLFASYIPAWRATRVDPITAVRYE